MRKSHLKCISLVRGIMNIEEDEHKSNTLRETRVPDLSDHILSNVNCALTYSQGLETKKDGGTMAYEIKPLQSTELHNGD